jgi:hypothetical protein
MSEGEGFLARWSRRKRAAAAGAPPATTPAVAEPPGAAAAEAAGPPGAAPAMPAEAAPPPLETPAAAGAAAEFDPASLPPVESLTTESDISAFLRPQVPAALRHAALRRAWTLDPAIRDFTGPADYAWDYNAPNGVPGFGLELGGDVKRLLAQAIGLTEEPEGSPAPEDAPAAEPATLAEAPALPELKPEPEPERPALSTETPGEEPAAEAPPAPPLPPRRHGGAIPV